MPETIDSISELADGEFDYTRCVIRAMEDFMLLHDASLTRGVRTVFGSEQVAQRAADVAISLARCCQHLGKEGNSWVVDQVDDVLSGEVIHLDGSVDTWREVTGNLAYFFAELLGRQSEDRRRVACVMIYETLTRLCSPDGLYSLSGTVSRKMKQHRRCDPP